MIKKLYTINFVITFISLLIIFSGPGYATSKNQSVKVTMNDVFDSFVKIIPYMNNEMKFKDPNNKKILLKHLTNIKKPFLKNSHLKKFDLPGFKPSYKLIIEHLNETISTLEDGQTAFANKRMNITANLCISCHTQLPNKSNRFSKKIKLYNRTKFDNDIEYADFLFLVKDYEQSITFYEKSMKKNVEENRKISMLMGKSNQNLHNNSINRALKRILTINTKINLSPDKALKKIKDYKKNYKFSADINSELSSWIKQLNNWVKVTKKSSLNNMQGFDQYVTTHFLDKNGLYADHQEQDSVIKMLVSSGLILNLLNVTKEPKNIQKLYLWLGRIEMNLNYNYFYSLSDVYLKECILGYPNSRFSQECYLQYKRNMHSDYTGSSGENIPEDVKKELRYLQTKISI